MSEDAGIEPRTVVTSALAVRCSSDSATSHPHSATSATSHPHSASHLHSATSHPHSDTSHSHPHSATSHPHSATSHPHSATSRPILTASTRTLNLNTVRDSPCQVLFRVVFSSAEWFGTDFLEFASILASRNGIPGYILFRWRVWKGIPRDCFFFGPLNEFRVVFSSAEGFGTEFRERSVPRNRQNSVGNNHLFRLFVFHGIIFLSEIPNPCCVSVVSCLCRLSSKFWLPVPALSVIDGLSIKEASFIPPHPPVFCYCYNNSTSKISLQYSILNQCNYTCPWLLGVQ